MTNDRDILLSESIEITGHGTLRVDLDLGSVRVESHAEPRITVDARASGWHADAVVFDLTRDGNDVLLEGRVERWRVSDTPRIEVRVTVPETHDVDLFARAGKLRVDGVGGRLAAETKAGAIAVRDCGGPVMLSAQAGDVRASGIRESLRVITQAGAVRLEDVDARAEVRTKAGLVRMRDMAGPVLAESKLGAIGVGFRGNPEGELSTALGSIEVRLPEGASANLDARAGHGSAVVDRPLPFDGPRRASQLFGPLGRGGRPLRLRTKAGTIRVRPAARRADRERAEHEAPA